MTSPISNVAPILAAIVVLAALLGAYVASYFWYGRIHGEVFGVSGPVQITRVFRYPVQAAIYKPAAIVESWSRQMEIRTVDIESWKIECGALS